MSLLSEDQWTPGESDFCSCGGIFSRLYGTCHYCGARKTLDNFYRPGPHDWELYPSATLEEEERENVT